MDKKRLALWGIGLAAGALLLDAGYYLGERAGLRESFSSALSPRESAPAVLALPADIEIADTTATQQKGLSDRPLIPDEYGMLFVFDRDEHHGFWMKDMLTPIDIVWLTKDGVIAAIEHEVAPGTYPQVLAPSVPTRYVLETRAGYAKEHRWEVGKRFDLSAYTAEDEADASN